MSVRTDVVNLQVNINGNQAQKDLADARKRAADLRLEISGLTKGTAEWVAKSKELKKVEADVVSLRKQIGITALTQKELTQELNRLKSLRGSVQPFTKEFKDLTRQIEATEKRLYDVRNGVTGFKSMLSRVKDEVKQFGMMAAGYLGFQFIAQQFSNMISGAAKLSDSLADLQRVTGMTKSEAKAFNEELKGLDTRTATQGLREIAIVAGKLGVAKDDLMGFTKAVDMLVVALGDELGNADQITSTLGKVLQVFDGTINGDNITRLGNSIVELANTGSSTGAFISDFDQRLSGIASSAGISLGALSGLGAGLEELGGRVESSSTAVQKIIITISKDIPAAAAIAGKSVEEFQKTFSQKPQEALLQYAEGLVKNKKSFSEITAAFVDAGEEGARVIETLSKIGESAEYLRGRMELGEQAMKQTSAITEAYALKNETLGATIDKLGKEFNRLVSSQAVTNFLKALVNGVTSVVQVIKGLGEWVGRNTTTFIAWSAAILTNTALWGKFTGLLLQAVGWFKTLTITINTTTLAQKAAAIATTAWSVVVALFTGNLARLKAEFALLRILMGTNPLGVFLIAVGAAVIAIKALSSALDGATNSERMRMEISKKATQQIADESAKVIILTSVIKDNALSLDTRQNALKELIALNPEYLSGLTLENIATAKGEEILKKYNKQLILKAQLQAAEDKIKEIGKKKLDLALEREEKERQIPAADRGYGSGGNKLRSDREELELEVRLIKDQEKELDKSINNILSISNEWTKKLAEPAKTQDTKTTDQTAAANTPAGRTLQQMKAELDAIEKSIETTDVTSAKFKELRAKRQKLQAEIDALTSSSSTPRAAAPKKAPKPTDEEMGVYYDQRLPLLMKKTTLNPPIDEKSVEDAKAKSKKNLDRLVSEMPALINSALAELEKSNRGRRAALELKVSMARGTERLDAIKQLLDQEMAMELANTELTESEKLLIKRKYDYLKAEEEKNALMKTLDDVIAVGAALTKIAGAWTDAKEQKETQAFNKEKQRAEQQKKLFKSQLNDKLISQKVYNQRVAAIDEELDAKEAALKKKQFERAKKIQIANALVSGAQAVLSVLAAMPGPLDLLSLGVARTAMIAGTIGATAFQVAQISKQQPSFGQGGLLKNGPKHSSPSGGLMVMDPTTGRVEAMVEQGEGIVNANAMAASTPMTVSGTPAQIASAINSAFGGIDFARGAYLSWNPGWYSGNPSISGKTVRVMQSGGVVGNTTAAAVSNGSTSGMSEMMTMMAAFLKKTESWPREVTGKWIYKDFLEEKTKYEAAQKASGLKG